LFLIIDLNMIRFFSSFIICFFLFHVNAQNISMTFHNGSDKPIYLVIPGVMNPNLSPQSTSGVSLEVGQKVYFFPKGNSRKKEVLFTVDSNRKKDTILKIDELIKTRKKELEMINN
jgi:hypothetical protein